MVDLCVRRMHLEVADVHKEEMLSKQTTDSRTAGNWWLVVGCKAYQTVHCTEMSTTTTTTTKLINYCNFKCMDGVG